MSPEKNFDAAPPRPSLVPFAALVGAWLAYLLAVGLVVSGVIPSWWMLPYSLLLGGASAWSRAARLRFERHPAGGVAVTLPPETWRQIADAASREAVRFRSEFPTVPTPAETALVERLDKGARWIRSVVSKTEEHRAR